MVLVMNWLVRALGDAISEELRRKKDKELSMPELPEEKTARVLASMMCESVYHILDSGDLYGRKWEERRKQGFKNLPDVHIRVYSDGDWYAVIDTFKFLTKFLEYDEELDREFHEYAKDRDDYWLAIMEDFADELFKDWFTVNTYNHEYNLLDQVIQFVLCATDSMEDIIYDSGAIMILQTHNGCDVRGGYSTPHVFRLTVPYADFVDSMESVDIACEKGHYMLSIHGEYISERLNGKYVELESESDASLIVDTKERVLRCPICRSPLRGYIVD